jgi:hypothetical protein
VAILAGLVASSPAGEAFGIRVNGEDLETSPTERLMALIASTTGHNVIRFKPDGVRSAYRRDYYMVEHSRLVVAFFSPGAEMSGGTGHVVKAALDRGVQVEAYTMDEDGEIMMIGSDPGTVGSQPWILREMEDRRVQDGR